MSSETLTRELALAAARAADERKASDIMVIKVGELIDMADYFVIVTARNNPQMEAVLDNVEEVLRKQYGVKPLNREGAKDPGWKLLDFGDIIVDVFTPESREHYRLESLWADAPVVDLAEAGIENVEYSDRIAKLVGHAEGLAR